MSFEFDSIQSGLNQIERIDNTDEKNSQLTIFNYQELEQSLPSIPDNIVNIISTKNKSKKKHKKKEKKQTENQIKLQDIKVMRPSKEFEERGLGKLNITGDSDGRVKENSLIASVIAQAKESTEEKRLISYNNSRYIKREGLFTEAEKKLYKFLKSRLPDDVIILSKVRLADLVDINKEVTRERKVFLQIAYKHIDYVIVNSNLDVICTVELDDFTHESDDRQQRDRFVEQVLRECNIPFYRVKCKIDLITKEDVKAIETCVYEYLAPVCPRCGRPMEVKSSRQSHNFGHRFYGCMGFYEAWPNKCTYTIDID